MRERPPSKKNLGASWVCEPNAQPRLVGRSPVGGIAYVAQRAETNGDVSRVQLHHASFYREGLELHAGRIEIRGLRPFVTPAALAPHWRALTVVLCALLSTVLLAMRLCARAVAPEPIPPGLALAAGLSGPVAGVLSLSAAAQRPWLAMSAALVLSAALPVLVLALRGILRGPQRAGR